MNEFIMFFAAAGYIGLLASYRIWRTDKVCYETGRVPRGLSRNCPVHKGSACLKRQAEALPELYNNLKYLERERDRYRGMVARHLSGKLTDEDMRKLLDKDAS